MSTPPALPASAAGDYTRIVADLTYGYDGVFDRDTVGRAVDQARVTGRQGLRLPADPDRTQRARPAPGRSPGSRQGRHQHPGDPVRLCPQRRPLPDGRSLARHLSAGKVHVRSAGSQPDRQIHPAAIQALAERGIEVTEAFPKPLTDDVLRAADVILTMGCGEACPVLPGQRYEDWCRRPRRPTHRVVRAIRDDIQARVTTLLGEIQHQT